MSGFPSSGDMYSNALSSAAKLPHHAGLNLSTGRNNNNMSSTTATAAYFNIQQDDGNMWEIIGPYVAQNTKRFIKNYIVHAGEKTDVPQIRLP